MWLTISPECVQLCDPRLNSTQSRRRWHFWPFFSNFDKCQPEVVVDVISGAALVYVGMDVRAKLVILGKQWPSYSTVWPAGPVLRTFVQYLITFYSLRKTASDVISDRFMEPVVSDSLRL